MLGEDKFIVVYHTTGLDDETPIREDIVGQMFDGSGTKVGDELILNSNSGSPNTPQNFPSVVGDGKGGFVLTFTEGSNVDADIIIKSFDGDGNPTSGEVQVNTTNAHTQQAQEIAKLSDGNYVVVWEAQWPGR